MCFPFKIYFPDSNIVLFKGDLLEFNWLSLKKKIIERIKASSYYNNNLLINENNIIFLEIIESPINRLDEFTLKTIDDERTFSYFLSLIKDYKNNNEDKNIKLKFKLVNNKEINQPDIPGYDLTLKKILNDVWKEEKKTILEKLSDAELYNSQSNYMDNINQEYGLMKNKENKNYIICNKCLKINFFGYKYICSYCDNMILCHKCYSKDNHDKNHNFILFKDLLMDNEIIKYDSKFSPCTQLFMNKCEQFEIDFKIINVGEVDLDKCYIGYLKFDKNYLYCEKTKIEEKIEKKNSKNMKLNIFFDNKDKDIFNFNEFEGHFRIFTEQGIPFGDVMKIKVVNNLLFKNI